MKKYPLYRVLFLQIGLKTVFPDILYRTDIKIYIIWWPINQILFYFLNLNCGIRDILFCSAINGPRTSINFYVYSYTKKYDFKYNHMETLVRHKSTWKKLLKVTFPVLYGISFCRLNFSGKFIKQYYSGKSMRHSFVTCSDV